MTGHLQEVLTRIGEGLVGALIIGICGYVARYLSLAWQRRNLLGEWYAMWQTNSADSSREKPWSEEWMRFGVDFLRRSVTFRTVRPIVNNYRWCGRLRLVPDNCIVGSWRNAQGNEDSKGALILTIQTVAGEHGSCDTIMAGFILGKNRRGFKNYGAFMLGRTREHCETAKGLLGEFGPSLGEIDWR